MRVTADIELTEVDGRRPVFRAEARAEKAIICRGPHQHRRKFEERLRRKADPQ